MSEKKTILVVDDELDITTYLTTLLEDNGYATLTATDGVQAMDLLRSKKPDLVTLDMSMPSMMMLPDVGVSKPESTLSKVLLPQPEPPNRQKSSP